MSRSRRRLDLVLAFSLLLLPFVVPGIPMFAREGIWGSDTAHFFVPHHRFLLDNLRRGVIPFWNPYIFGGEPAFGMALNAPMYPPYLVPLVVLGPMQMMKAKLVFHIGLAGLGFYLLLRALSAAPWLALIGGLTFEFCGYTITKAQLVPIGDSAAWIPLMLFLNLRFARRPTLRRGLWLALAGGTMLLLFVPQIVLPLYLLMAVLGAAGFVKCRGGTRVDSGTMRDLSREEPAQAGTPNRSEYRLQPASRRFIGPAAASWVDRGLLPVAELTVIVTLVRYPEGGWRQAVSGLGRTGTAALIAVAALWVLWLGLRRLRVRVRWGGLARWAAGFAGACALSLALAAPQLAVTVEEIPYSNQAGLKYERKDFFTGAQAYGCVQNFVEMTALGRYKETDNNMALGPGVYLLIAAGVAGGFHRRRRIFLLLLIGAALTAAVYFAAPGVFFEVFRRLPFFRKFAGLSRYQAFLNVFLILLAFLSAQMWIRRARGKRRAGMRWVVVLVLLANLGVLLRHEYAYLRKVLWMMEPDFPAPVAQMIRATLAADERFLIDARGQESFIPYLMFGMQIPHAGVPSYNAMYLQGYRDWLEAHNRSLGVDYSEYHASRMEPTPSPWTRILRVRGYLFPPGMPRADESGRLTWPLTPVADAAGWRLMFDREMLPFAWPENDLRRNPPVPEIPAGWNAKVWLYDLHRIGLEVDTNGGADWLVVPMFRYPGWTARIDGRRVESATAYSFLQAYRIPESGGGGAEGLGPGGPGRRTMQVELAYKPHSFAWGWLCFLWGVWIWTVLFGLTLVRGGGGGPSVVRDAGPGLTLEREAGRRTRIVRGLFAAWAAAGACVAGAAAGYAVFAHPDALKLRCGEFVFVWCCAIVAAWYCVARARRLQGS